MKTKWYERLYKSPKEIPFLIALFALVIISVYSVISANTNSISFDGKEIDFRKNPESATAVVSALVEEAVARAIEPLQNELSSFIDYYKWHEYNMMRAESTDPNPAIAAHVKEAIELLNYNDRPGKLR